jgi:hypothetical protein
MAMVPQLHLVRIATGRMEFMQLVRRGSLRPLLRVIISGASKG